MTDPLDIPPYLRRKLGEPKPTYTTPARSVGDIIAAETYGDRPKWQERDAAIKEQKKEQKLTRLQKLKDQHPGMRWNPKLHKWVPTQKRKRRSV